MKRLKVYIGSVLMMLLLGQQFALACCCSDPWSDGQRYDFCLYRVEEDGRESPLSKERLKARNIALWQKQTSLTRQQVVSLIYPEDGNLEDVSAVRTLLKSDSVACQLVLLARNCEIQRSKLSSAWYYAIEEDEPHTVLAQIAHQCEQEIQKGGRMRDRFLLQAVRAQFALRQYAQCIALWHNYGGKVKEEVIRDMIEPYIAGCYYHQHQPQLAMPIFIRHEDISSLKLCYSMIEYRYDRDSVDYERLGAWVLNRDYSRFERLECFKIMAEFYPNIPNLGKRINPYLTSACHQLTGWYDRTAEVKECRDCAIKAAQRASGHNKCLWYYAAAALSDVLGEHQETLRWIERSRQCNPSSQMSANLRLLEYQTCFAHDPIGPLYEQKVQEFVVWADAQMLKSFNRSSISPRLSSNEYYCWAGLSPKNEAEYWNHALRKMVFCYISKRYESVRQYESLLKLANYAENRYLRLCNGAYLWKGAYWYDNDDNTPLTRLDEKFDFAKYIAVEDSWNANYSTELFHLVDSLPARVLNNYLIWMEQPHEGFDQLLLSGSNTNRSYWNEMLGTHYLREQNYKCARRALARVSKSFPSHMNVCFDRDPFTLQYQDPIPQCKFSFAEEMVELERKIASSKEDDKAEYMLRYALGMENSVKMWQMTAYEWHSGWKPAYSWRKEHYSEFLENKADELRENALSLFTDRNRKAQALLALHRRMEIMRDLRDTQTAKFLVRHCDLWKDYAQKHPVN